MIIYSPRIHNLGDFAHCLPALSGLYKKTEEKISFGICDRLSRFKGIKNLLMHQEMFSDVYFMSEISGEAHKLNYFIIDDCGRDSLENINANAAYRQYNFLKDNYNLDFDIDNDFDLHVPYYNNIDYFNDKFLVADRWSPSDAPDVDDRRKSNLLKSSGLFDSEKYHYLKYSDDLVYNCSLIKYNKNPLYTTFTGTGILADLMKKEVFILYDDDVVNWDNKPIQYSYDLHYIKNRKSKLRYIKEFNYE